MNRASQGTIASLALAATIGLASGCECPRGSESDASATATTGSSAMAPIQDSNAAETFRGTLRGGMMGIGGEHTGFELTLDDGGRIEVEPGAMRAAAHALDGLHVVITGTVETKPYVERGNVQILRAAAIQADAAGGSK